MIANSRDVAIATSVGMVTRTGNTRIAASVAVVVTAAYYAIIAGVTAAVYPTNTFR